MNRASVMRQRAGDASSTDLVAGAEARPPLVGPGAVVLRRPELEKRLDESFGKRLTTVVAGAGYGKSMLVSAWARDVESIWYPVAARDVVLNELARGLLATLGDSLPAWPTDLRAALDAGQESGTDESIRAQVIAASLCEALRVHRHHDLVLILDDVHELPSTGDSARFIEAICRQAPPTLHVVLVSRTEPPFAVGRLRIEGELLEIGAGALAFSVDEVASLLDASLGSEAADHAQAVFDATDGWPAAVRLAVELFREASPQEGLARLPERGGPLFDYLATEVFAREQPAVRTLLGRAALFECFSPELCQAVGADDAVTTIRGLVQRGLFVHERGREDGWFVLHPLMRRFAAERWPHSEEELRRLHRLAAEWFETNGHLGEAIESSEAASDHATLARLLREHGHRLVEAGAVHVVVTRGERLPETLRDSTIDELLGQAHWVQGDWDTALAYLSRVAADDEKLPARLAWRIGAIHHLRARPAEALSAYARALVDGSDPMSEALLLAWAASAHWMLGEAEECRRVGDQAVEAARAAGNAQALASAEIALGLVAAMAGDPVAHAHFQRALDAAEQSHDLLQVIRIRVNWQMPFYEEGRYADALDQVERAVRLAELSGFAFYQALALHNRAEIRLAMGRLDEAAADDEAARSIFQRLDSDWVAVSHLGLGNVYLERGELQLARAAFEAAIAAAERSGEKQALIGASAALARVVAQDEPELADRLIERALSFGPWYGYPGTLVAAGWVALARANRDEAARLSAAAERTARARLSPAGIASALELQALVTPDPPRTTALLREALAVWREIGNALGEARAEFALTRLSGTTVTTETERARRRLQELGVRVDAPAAAGLLAALPPPEPPAVAVHSLGAFRVLREGQPIPLAEWQSKKARDVLKILVARRGRATPRDVLIAALWPGEDPAEVSNRLSVALSILRSVLDPDKRFDQEHFIGADKNAVSLDRASLVVDIEEFLEDAREGFALHARGNASEALERLASAEAAYAGDFLEEDAYEEWTISLREEARSTYTSVARALAEEAGIRGDSAGAVRYLLRILEHDGFDERAHLSLVSVLVGAGRHGEARRAYRLYVSRMEEIGIEAVPFPTR